MERLKFTPAAECKKRSGVDWLWDPYIPAGRITVLDGDPGLGKSFVTLDLCARLTTGRPWPNETGDSAEGHTPRNVVICNCEDEREVTMVPRLAAAEANLTRVVFGEKIDDDETGKAIRFLRLPKDEPLLEKQIVDWQAALVVIDPIMAFLGEEVRTNSDQSVRQALNGLNLIGSRTGAAFLLVRHLNKGGGQKAIYRGGGSIGFVGLARSALMVARNPDVPKETLLLHSKANLSRPGKSLAFELSFRRGVGRVRWKGVSDITANQALREEEPPTAVERAKAFLQSILSKGAEVPVTEILEEGKKLAIAPASIIRAKKKMMVFARRKMHNSRLRWFWSTERKEAPMDEFLAGLPRG